MMEHDGLDSLIVDLTQAGLTAGVKADRVLDRSGERIVKTARQLAPKTGLEHYAKTITHEVLIEGQAIIVEVGPEKGGQGSLGHILERGTVDTPPHAHLWPAVDIEAPRVVKDLGDAVGEL